MTTGPLTLNRTRYLEECRTLVDQYLDDYLPTEDTPPQMLSRAVRYSLFAGGKRLRPTLVLATAEAVGGNMKDALPAAAAFEMIHTYSLIHDDLPAMDNDSLRRGQPTSHIVFGEAMAILAGDALQTHAFEVIAQPSGRCQVPTEERMRAVAVLAEATGARGMVGGQVADLESEGTPADAEMLEFIHRHKTGALIRASVEVGAIVGGGDEKVVYELRRFGEEIGLAFQIVDDILDVVGTAESLGKTVGKDSKAGKATYPAVHGMEDAKRRAQDLRNGALDRLKKFGSAGKPLAMVAERIVSRSS